MSIDPGIWYEIKELLRTGTGWPMDTLHVIGGVLVQLALAGLLRTSLASKWPWLLVLALELANESYDLWLERWPSMSMQLGEGLRDLVGTMLLPSLLWWIACRHPRLLAAHRR